MNNERVENWKKFSEHMENYVREKTIKKYGFENSGSESCAFDLMSITKPIVCVWNILEYSLRIWNGNMKENDLEKVAHYAELAWTMSGGENIKVN